jgi:hypothetical protein
MDIVDLQRVEMNMFLQSKCESIFDIIVDLQGIQINKLTVQMQINMGIISTFKQTQKEKSFKY